jgi:hypothetical protein
MRIVGNAQLVWDGKRWPRADKDTTGHCIRFNRGTAHVRGAHALRIDLSVAIPTLSQSAIIRLNRSFRCSKTFFL